MNWVVWGCSRDLCVGIWRSSGYVVISVPNLTVPSNEGTAISFSRMTVVHGICRMDCANILKVKFVAHSVQDIGYMDFPK